MNSNYQNSDEFRREDGVTAYPLALPWRVGPVNEDPKAGVIGETALIDARGYYPAVVLPCGTEGDRTPAYTLLHAHLIVTAVNAFDELVLAAKEAAVVIADIAKITGDAPQDSPVLMRLTAAIAKASAP